jgi:PAS domain S-box-containing protein
VVDDRADDRRLLTEALAAYEVVAATTAAEALRHLAQRDFAAIILEVVLPDVDGLGLAEQIRGGKRSPQTPIFVLTGASTDPQALRRAYGLGAVDYLVKPVDAEIVSAKLGVFVQLFEKDRRIHLQAEALLEAARRNRELELEQVRLSGSRRYRNLADALPQIVWTADLGGAPTFFNRRWFEYTGAEGQRDWLVAVHPDDRSTCSTLWESALRDGLPFEVMCRLRRHDGRSRSHLLRVLPERGADGETLGWIGTVTDLDDLMRAHQATERAIHLRDEFLSIASHELRTPLSALLVQLGSMQRTLHDSRFEPPTQLGRVDQKVTGALRHVGRLTRLVDDLLDISRLGKQTMTLEREELNLAEVARDVADRFVEVAQQAGCVLAVHTAVQVVGSWDRVRVEQVITNLLSNAVKYGRGCPIEVTVAADAARAHLRVRDQGIGIAAEDQARIFERFERAVSLQHYGGLGLGLYIARTIVEAHGGGIQVHSEPGAGATFIVNLPLAGGGA